MTPLEVLLVGCGEQLEANLRQELANLRAHIAGVYPDVRGLLSYQRQVSEWTGSSKETRSQILIVHLRPKDEAYPQHNNEAILRHNSELAVLREIRNAFPNHPVLLLLDATTDASTLLELMREGATQTIVLPFQVHHFRTAMDGIGTLSQQSTRSGRIIVVSGASGGCGTTAISLNLAAAISEKSLRVILLEFSWKLGLLATYVNIDPDITITDVCGDIARQGTYLLKKALVQVTENLSVVVGPHRVFSADTAQLQNASRVIQLAQTLADVVVIDLAQTFDPIYFQTLSFADQTVLICEQTVASLRTWRLIFNKLNEVARIGEIYPVLNMYNPTLKGFAVKDLVEIFNVPAVFTIAKDDAVQRSLNNGQLLGQSATNSPAFADIDRLSETLLGIRPREKTGLFRKLFGSA